MKRLFAIFDSVSISDDLRMKTCKDICRNGRGEIKPETVYRNLTRRIEAAKRDGSQPL